jgi:hypothetical protein
MRLQMSLAVAALAVAGVRAQEPAKHERCERPEREMRERVGWRVPDYPHTSERAGCPQCISKHAVCDRGPHDYLGYIGGGCLGRRGEGRGIDEGTIGWDYVLFKKWPGTVFLNWCHCREKQPQVGPYKTDGPYPPDVFALRPVKRFREKAIEKAKCEE